MFFETENLLKNICRNLSKGDVYNFVADAKLLQFEIIDTTNEISLIEKSLGKNAQVGGIEQSNLSELLYVVKECFEYIGDEGSYPNKKYLASEQFSSDKKKALESIKNLFCDSKEIYAFWLKEGHPFYPVYWDYAFLVKNDEKCFILIGSSSD
jgi:hypothetical protein